VIANSRSAIDSVRVPILFKPYPQSGAVTYTALVVLKVTMARQYGKSIRRFVQGIGQGIDLTVASQFANPVDRSEQRYCCRSALCKLKTVLNVPLNFLDIRRIELTYVYDQNILNRRQCLTAA